MSHSPTLRRAFGMLSDATRGLEGLVDCSNWHRTVADAGAELDALERELDELRANGPALVAALEERNQARCELDELRKSNAVEAAVDLKILRARGERVADLERERAGLCETIAALRTDHAALRAELEAAVEAHGRTSRDLADARAELLEIDRELVVRASAETRARELVEQAELDATVAEEERNELEDAIVMLEGELTRERVDDLEDARGVIRRVGAVVQSARRKLDKRRGASAQPRTRAQRPSTARSRSNARATGQAGGGSTIGAPNASTPRKNAERTRLPKLPPPAPAPAEESPKGLNRRDNQASAPSPEFPGEVQDE